MVKRNFLTVATTVLALTALIGCQTPATTDAPEDSTEAGITIGYMGGLSGGVASIATDEKRAIELAFGENPTINGEAVKFVYEDSKCDGTAAVTAAQKLVSTDKVEVILGALCSSATIPATQIANDNGVLLFSSASTSPELTEAGGEYFFRNAPSDADSAEVLALAVAEREQKVAMISENADFSKAYREEMMNRLPEAGVEILVDEVYNPDTKDFKTILQKVKDSEATGLILLPQTSEAAGLLVKQAAELGIEMQIYGADTMTGEEFTEIARDAVNGILLALVGVPSDTPRMQEFISNYTAKYGEAPASTTYAALSYDRAMILKQALEAVGNDADALKGYLANMPAYDGLGGMTSFDENGDSSLKPILHQFVDGSPVPVSE